MVIVSATRQGIGRRPSGGGEGEDACRGRRGGGSPSPANKNGFGRRFGRAAETMTEAEWRVAGLPATSPPPMLDTWRDTPVPELNPLWPMLGPDGSSGARCAGCVWHFVGGRGKAVDRCRRHRSEPVDARWPACPAYTAAVDCLTCGACCREAYHSVEVGPRDAFVRLHPDRVNAKDGRLEVTRSGERCGCLSGGPGAYECVVYADRPRTCRDFPAGGQSCVEARRRVGLTV